MTKQTYKDQEKTLSSLGSNISSEALGSANGASMNRNPDMSVGLYMYTIFWYACVVNSPEQASIWRIVLFFLFLYQKKKKKKLT